VEQDAPTRAPPPPGHLEPRRQQPTNDHDTSVARRILALIDQDIADRILPANVRTYADLHTYVDANDYLDHAGVPGGSSQNVNDLVAAVQEKVTVARR
jgi:hypothetical protein